MKTRQEKRDAYIEVKSTLMTIHLNTESVEIFKMTEKALDEIEVLDPDDC